MAASLVRGRPDRIALIHAIYAAAWSALALSQRAPVPLAIALLAGAAIVGVTAAAKMRGGSAPPDPDTGAAITRINIVTAVAVVVVTVLAHRWPGERWAVPLVLAVMGLHFVPLWRLLRRRSMLAMAAVLLLAAAVPAIGAPVSLSALVAALAFLVNAAGLVMRRRRR